MTKTTKTASAGPTATKPTSPVDVAGDEVSRRTMLRGAAVGGLALPLLAACGGGDGEASESPPTAAESSSADPSADPSAGGAETPSESASAAAGGTMVAAADVPVGGGTILTDEKLVVTQPTKGDFKAFSAVCTHKGCPVSEITDGEIICKCHGSHFSIEDGSATAGPATAPLGAKTATVNGDQISVA